MSWLKKIFQRPGKEEAQRRLQEGVVHARSGRLEEALAAYRAAIAADPDNAIAHLNEALALQDLYNRESEGLSDDERRARLEEIADALERALKRDESLLAAWRSLGHVSRRLARYVRAEEAFARLLELAPDDFPHREEAERELKVVEVRAHRERVLKRAIDLAVSKESTLVELREALEKVRPLLVHADVPADAFWAAGVLMKRLDDKKGAREMFEACVERDPRHLNARRQLATLCIHTGEVREALEHSLAAFREAPSDPAVVCNVGVCHLSLGDLEQAEEFLKMAKGMAPSDPIVQRAWAALEKARAEAQAG